MVKVTQERLPDAQVVLNIEVEPEAVVKATERAFQSLSSRINVPGFRRGKAPRYLVERMIGGAEALKQEGIERLVPQAYREAIEQEGLSPIDQPELEVVTADPLVVKATVSVEPKVELGDYKAIRLPKVAVDVPYERINETIERLRDQQTQWEPVTRAAKAGDRVTADVLGTVGVAPTLFDPTGQPLAQSEGGDKIVDNKNVEIEVNPESAQPVPGFHQHLVGVNAGNTTRFVQSLPADWPDEAHRSKTIIFDVKVHDVKEAKVPALDDEFAKAVGSEFETLDQLRENIRERLREQLEHEAEHQYEDSIVNEVIAVSRIEMPPALVKRETDRLVANFERSLARQRLNLDQYLQLSKKTIEEMWDELKPSAEANLRSFLVLREIGRAEGIEVAGAEVDSEIGRIAGLTGDESGTRKLLDKPDQREDIQANLWHRKVIGLLTEIAQRSDEEKEVSAPDPSV